MKKKLLLSVLLMLIFGYTYAQFGYDLSVQNRAYQPLTNGTNLNTGLWDEEIFVTPLGFNFSIDGKTIDTFYVQAGYLFMSDTSGVISGFGIHDADVADRGLVNTGTSVSPVRYEVSGSVGSRIFKLETFNAGFYEELDKYGTMNDSLNIQVWLYEGSNIIEFHYGDSKISHFSDYFLSAGITVGFIRNMDLSTYTFDKQYLLSGSPAMPVVDSIDTTSMSIPNISGYPASGTVYRFTPAKKTTSISNFEDKLSAKVYPTQCNNTLFIEYDGAPVAYSITNITGNKVIAGEIVSGKNSVDVSNLAEGMYILKIAENNSVYRVIKL